LSPAPARRTESPPAGGQAFCPLAFGFRPIFFADGLLLSILAALASPVRACLIASLLWYWGAGDTKELPANCLTIFLISAIIIIDKWKIIQ